MFLVEAALLSSLGGALGLLAGIAGTTALQAVYPRFPVQTPTWAIAAALAVSAGVGVLFGALPAYRASRLDPVIALGRG